MIKFDSTKIGILSFACGLLCTGLVGYFCYDAGYDHGKAEAEAMQSAAVANAQRKVKQDYEIQIKELTASLERVRNDNAKRLREFNDFNNARTDLQPAAVNEASLQEWRSEVRSYSKELTAILKRSSKN